MSSINNVITTTFRARGGNVVAQLGAYSQGFGRLGQVINQNTRLSERLNAQWRAFGTTIRYAVAGQSIFGLVRLAGQLRDIQVQMGLISAIGEQAGGRPIVGTDLTDLMNQSRAGAINAITPVNEYNDAIINLLSTIQGIPRDQITPIVTDISQAARLAQVSAEDATKAFTTMNVAFGQQPNRRNIQRMAQEFFILTREAPGGVAAGQQVIGQLGQLAQVTRAAHGTPQDMFSLLLTTLRSGIPPAQAGRGLQFLIQTLAFPGQQTSDSRRALQSVGITPTTTMPLQERLARIFGRARQLGMGGNLSRLTNLDEDTLNDLESMGTESGLSQLGITGRGAQFLGQIFHRIHALRTALAIEGQINTGQAQADLSTMNDAAQGHVKDVNDLAKAWKRFRDQAKLQEASIALNTMGLQIASTFAPVLNFVAGHVTGVAQAMGRHPRLTRDITLGGAAFLGAMGIGRALGVGNLPVLRRIPGLRSILGAGGGVFVRENAVQAALSGNAALGASPQNPVYVTVVGQLFGGGTPGPSGSPIAPAAGGAAGGFLARSAGQAWRLLRRSPRLATGLFAAEAPALGDAWDWLVHGINPTTGRHDRRNPLVRFFDIRDQSIQAQQVQRAQEIWGRQVRGFHDADQRKLHGRAEIFMTLDMVDAQGKHKTKRVHVPVDLWSGGRVPKTAGQSGKGTRG